MALTYQTSAKYEKWTKTTITYKTDGRVVKSETPVETDFVLDMYDTRTVAGRPIRTLQNGEKWRDPTPYQRSGYRDNYIGGIRQRKTSTSNSTTVTLSRDRYRGGTSCEVPGFFKNSSFVEDYDQRAAAEMKCLGKLADGKVSLSMMSAESRLTFELLGERSIQGFRALRAMKRGHWGSAARILGFETKKSRRYRNRKKINNWSSFWLEYQYGWKPFVNDLKGIYDVARSYGEQPYFLVTAKASVLATGAGGAFESGSQPYAYVSSGSRRYTVAITGKIENETLRSASQFGLINPLVIAWELVPFSFVIDWFMPIGQFLEALTGLAGLRFQSGTSSVFHKTSVTYRELPINSTYSYMSERALHRDRYSLVRTVLGGFPLPKIYARNPITGPRVVSAAALFHQIRLK